MNDAMCSSPGVVPMLERDSEPAPIKAIGRCDTGPISSIGQQ
jgi:hypothetical protein